MVYFPYFVVAGKAALAKFLHSRSDRSLLPFFVPFFCIAAFLACMPLASTVAQDDVVAPVTTLATSDSTSHTTAQFDFDALRSHTETLADDAFEGREAGQPGGRAAGVYIVKALQDSGLPASGVDGTFFQPFGRGYRNILATIPGTAPDLKEEFVVLSAHYDHVGRGNKNNSNGGIGAIHNGADDNASGVAAVLEIAKRLASRESSDARLRRSVLVVFWDAEEKGLLGSKHWLANPTLPLEKIRYVVNVDMIGRLREELLLYGTRTMPDLRLQWSRANQDTKLRIAFPWEVINNSDHYAFFEQKFPVTMVHTGLHDDYHRFSDDAHRLDVEGIARIAQVIFELVSNVANQDDLPPFREASLLEHTGAEKYYERPYRQQQRRLGLTVEPRVTVAGDGLHIKTVWDGSPASRAGLRPGGQLLKAGGAEVRTAAELRRRIARAAGGISLEYSEDGEMKTLNVQLEGTPQRIGLSWRTNDAEPSSVTVSGILPGSPAEASGLQRLDRILEIAGNAVTSSDQFREQVVGSEGVVELRVERNGRLLSLQLQTPPKPRDPSLDGD